MSVKLQKTGRFILGCLLLLVAINAFGGGYYGLAGAKDVPLEWLEGSPFSDYFIPSLFLFVAIGGLSLAAGILVLAGKRLGLRLAQVAGVVLICWIAVQLAIIGYVSWLQPASAATGTIILVLSWLLLKANPLQQAKNKM